MEAQIDSLKDSTNGNDQTLLWSRNSTKPHNRSLLSGISIFNQPGEFLEEEGEEPESSSQNNHADWGSKESKLRKSPRTSNHDEDHMEYYYPNGQREISPSQINREREQEREQQRHQEDGYNLGRRAGQPQHQKYEDSPLYHAYEFRERWKEDELRAKSPEELYHYNVAEKIKGFKRNPSNERHHGRVRGITQFDTDSEQQDARNQPNNDPSYNFLQLPRTSVYGQRSNTTKDTNYFDRNEYHSRIIYDSRDVSRQKSRNSSQRGRVSRNSRNNSRNSSQKKRYDASRDSRGRNVRRNKGDSYMSRDTSIILAPRFSKVSGAATRVQSQETYILENSLKKLKFRKSLDTLHLGAFPLTTRHEVYAICLRNPTSYCLIGNFGLLIIDSNKLICQCQTPSFLEQVLGYTQGKQRSFAFTSPEMPLNSPQPSQKAYIRILYLSQNYFISTSSGQIFIKNIKTGSDAPKLLFRDLKLINLKPCFDDFALLGLSELDDITGVLVSKKGEILNQFYFPKARASNKRSKLSILDFNTYTGRDMHVLNILYCNGSVTNRDFYGKKIQNLETQFTHFKADSVGATYPLDEPFGGKGRFLRGRIVSLGTKKNVILLRPRSNHEFDHSYRVIAYSYEVRGFKLRVDKWVKDDLMDQILSINTYFLRYVDDHALLMQWVLRSSWGNNTPYVVTRVVDINIKENELGLSERVKTFRSGLFEVYDAQQEVKILEQKCFRHKSLSKILSVAVVETNGELSRLVLEHEMEK